MSWQAYIDTQLTATGQVAEACMLGKADASLWAGTPDFMPRGYNADVSNEDGSKTAQPINEAAGMVSTAATLKPAKPGGFRINGQKYMPVRTMPTGVMDDNLPTIYFKKPKARVLEEGGGTTRKKETFPLCVCCCVAFAPPRLSSPPRARTFHAPAFHAHILTSPSLAFAIAYTHNRAAAAWW
jgi:hypothetical protein